MVKHISSILKTTLFIFLSSGVLPSISAALDFDQDGYDDFVLIDVNAKNRLEWYAIDINDAARRSLGQFGKVGDHLAVGNWSGNSITSKALIKKKDDGNFEWSMQLPGGQKNLMFGSYPDTVISGLDTDKNGAIDPVIISKKGKKLDWKVLTNPALGNTTVVQEVKFGAKKDVPFYSNIDGQGDRLCTASVNRKKVLTLRCLNLISHKAKAFNIKNFNSKVSNILPASLPNGKDILFAVSKSGKKINVNLIKGNKKVKSLKVKGDEVVVGRYLGGTAEVLVVRVNESSAIIIDAKGKKTLLPINLSGVLADEINVNSFKKSDGSNGSPPSPAPTAQAGATAVPPVKNPGSNPVCSGTALSTEHLLYKPVSDTSGNAVIVFDSVYAREFLAVRIELKDGTFAEAWWKGLELWGNPDGFGPRQHWRTNVRASQVKDNALIIADDINQTCRFTLPGSSNRRWE